MLIIGLTGSIATGKSTASRILSSPPHNIPVIDADVLARTVVAPGTPALRKIVAHFGPTTPDLLNEDGSLNRPTLGRRVFGDSEERKRDRKVLEGVTHPAVRWEMYKQILSYYLLGHWALILDIPLLFESHLDMLCGATLVVSVSSPSVQLSRLLARDKSLGGTMTQQEAESRVMSQMPLSEKVALCEGVFGGGRGRGKAVLNDDGVEELEKELGVVIGEWKQGREGWWRVLLWGCPLVAACVGGYVVAGNWWARRGWDKLERQGREKAKL